MTILVIVLIMILTITNKFVVAKENPFYISENYKVSNSYLFLNIYRTETKEKKKNNRKRK